MKQRQFTRIPSAMLMILACILICWSTLEADDKASGGTYTAVIEGFDWGAAVSKVILPLESSISELNGTDYDVLAERHSDCADFPPEQKSSQRTIVYAYVSDARGKRVDEGSHATLVLAVGPDLYIGSPLQYLFSDKCRGTKWVDYKMTIRNRANGDVWDQEGERIHPLIDKFDLSGRFQHDASDVQLTYASFTPPNLETKRPLIIWLHGGGEGGTDTSVPLLANRAANYASEDIQAIFGGAYVLVPQTPGAWMHTKEGKYFQGRENDGYNAALMALIQQYVSENPSIDQDRIYVGGCSNGGYMSIKLLILHPEYFAAGFISALAYQSKDILDEEIERIKDIPMWFVHAKDDQVTPAAQTATPVYQRLIAAGAKKTHYSLYDHVVDITGFYGGDNYRYNGHLSWIYVHANRSRLDYDGSAVRMDGRPTTIMEWMAGQEKESRQ